MVDALMASGSHGGVAELSATNALSLVICFWKGELKAQVESYVRHSSFPSPSLLLKIVQSSLSLSPLPSRQTSAHFYACSALPIRSRHVYLEGWVDWGEGRHNRQALNSCPNLILSHVFSTTFNHSSL